ncbi:MAG: anti-sigma factor antagonist [Lachnospiraceae bacterium]|nr:anti-sigma factor antagonist [Lachnospiraceae bacterium]
MGEKETFEIRENCLVVRLPEELDHHVAGDICRLADHYMTDERVQQIVFDFSRTLFMDSSGIGLVAGRNEKIMYLGGRTIIANANRRIRKMFKIAGLQEKICIMED